MSQRFSAIREMIALWFQRFRPAYWPLLWLDRHWQDFDATPPDWNAFEKTQTPWWQSVGDVWAWLNHQFSRWREATAEGEGDNRPLWGLAGILTTALFWRLLRRQRVRRPSAQSTTVNSIRLGASAFGMRRTWRSWPVVINAGASIRRDCRRRSSKI